MNSLNYLSFNVQDKEKSEKSDKEKKEKDTETETSTKSQEVLKANQLVPDVDSPDYTYDQLLERIIHLLGPRNIEKLIIKPPQLVRGTYLYILIMKLLLFIIFNKIQLEQKKLYGLISLKYVQL